MINIDYVPANSELRVGRVEVMHKAGLGQEMNGTDKNYRLSMCNEGTRYFLVFASKATSQLLKDAYRTSDKVENKVEITDDQVADIGWRLSMETEADVRTLLSLLNDEYVGIQTPNPVHVKVLLDHGFTNINTTSRFRQMPFSEQYEQADADGLINKDLTCRLNLHVTCSDPGRTEITQRAYAVITTDGRVWVDYDRQALNSDNEIRGYMVSQHSTWIYDYIILYGKGYAHTIIELQSHGFTVASPENRRERLNVTVSAVVLDKMKKFMEKTGEVNISHAAETLLNFAVEHIDGLQEEKNQEKIQEKVMVNPKRKRGRPRKTESIKTATEK